MDNKVDITPAESVCPIYREIPNPEQQALDAAHLVSETNARTERQISRQALLARLGITEEEAVLLLGGN